MPFEEIKHIYVTENSFARYLAHNVKVKFGEYDIAFAKDIDFIISKFWFKLKKGFNEKNQLPKSFDVITKAKIIISSHLNSSISSNYEKLRKDYKAGELTEEKAVLLNENYKSKISKPEEISHENIDSSLEALYNADLQDYYLREQSKKDELLNKTLEDKLKLEEKVKAFEQREAESKALLQQEVFDNEISSEVLKLWNAHLKSLRDSCKYFFCVLFLTIAPVIIGVVFKAVPSLEKWLDSFGNYKYIFWGLLFLLLVAEVLGRSYLFDKDKVKRGWNFILLVFRRGISEYKSNKTKELENNLRMPISNIID